MADDYNITEPDIGVTTSKVRAREIGAATPPLRAQRVDVAAWIPTVVTGAQYNLTVTTGAVTTLTVPTGATHCLLTVEANNVRMTEDSSAPSSTAGLLLVAGFVGELPLPNALKFIAIGGSAILQVTYRKYI